MINTLHLGLSYNCNMRCRHCFVNKQQDIVNINKIKKTLDYLDDNGLFFLFYTYGEPLMTKNFWIISKYVSKKNIIQTLMTNGSLINEEHILRLKENRVNNIYVSLDSINEYKHDNNRNYVGAYKKAIRALKLLAYNKFNVGIATTINDNNVKEMNDILLLAKKMNVKKVSFLRQRINNAIIPLKYQKEYEKFYINYLCSKEKNVNIIFHDPTLLNATNDLYKKGKISINLFEKYYDMNSCHYSSTLSIEPNGDVKHCNLINKTIGNLNDLNIEMILNRKELNNECFSCFTKLSK